MVMITNIYILILDITYTDMQAAIGLSQLNKLDNFIKIRRKNYEYLRKAFDKFEEFDFINIDKKSKPTGLVQ